MGKKSAPHPGTKRGEVHTTLRGELFGTLEFVKGRESERITESMLAVRARPRNH